MDYRRAYVRDLFDLAPGTEASAYGWVKTRRDSKGVSFVQLSDGSCFQDLQVVIPVGTIPDETLKALTTGACVRFDGAHRRVAQGRARRSRCRPPPSSSSAPPTRRPTPCRRRARRWSSSARSATSRPAATPSAPSTASATRPPGPSTSSSRTGASTTSTPPSSPPATPRARARCSRSPPASRPSPPSRATAACATASRRPTPPRTSSASPPSSPFRGQLEAETLALGMTNVYTFGPTFRAENSQHLAPPRRVLDGRARDGLLRPGGRREPRRGVPQGGHRPRPRPVRRRPRLLQPARRARPPRDPGARRRPAPSSA